DKILSLAEVQLFQVTDNLARGGKATQSSTDYSGEPQRAIDGNTNGDYFAANSTTHTRQENDPWWEVDLGGDKPIERIVLWNRTDGEVGSRLPNSRVLVVDKDRKTVWQSPVAEPQKPSREVATSTKFTVSLAQGAADFSQQDFPVASALGQKDLAQSGWA